MKTVLLAVIGEDDDAGEVIHRGFEIIKPDTIVLLVKKGFEKYAKRLEKEYFSETIEIKTDYLSKDPLMEEVFMKVKYYSEYYSDDSVVINVDSDYYTSCLALSSAFVNGIAAIGMLKDEVIAYPIMKFSYYNAINEKKFSLLDTIYQSGRINSMEELSQLSNMSLPLIAYHLRGNKDSKGLIEMNLVETEKNNGTIAMELTPLGRLIVKGAISGE